MLAVVPARGGSDSVPYLNIKRLGDKPLLAHTIDAARGAASIDRIVVSTDDPTVADAAKTAGAEVPFLRPSSLARDMSSLKPVIAHAVEEVEAKGDRVDLVLWLQATSPFRSAADIEQALDRLLAGGFDSVVSVTEDRTLNWREQEGRLVRGTGSPKPASHWLVLPTRSATRKTSAPKPKRWSSGQALRPKSR